MNITELRSHRIFGIAIFDLVTGILGMILLFLIAWKWHFPTLDWWKFVIAAILLTIPTGMVVHILVGTNTQLNYDLGLSGKPNK